MTRRLHLNVNILHAGFSPAAWRVPEVDPRATFDVGHYVRCARIAERGKLDAVFLADTPAITDRIDHRPALALEPTIVLAAIAAATERIGLIATVSTTFNEPYNIARRFATLDHASQGRTGINLVTNADPGSARNFGLTTQPDHGWRYERAGEFAGVLKALWDSWDDDAVVADKAAGRFVDLGRVRPISWRGKHFAVEGPLNLPRPPQGHPVVLQAGGSADGQELAARHAEAVFSASQDIDESRGFAAELKARAAGYGRRGGVPLNLAGLVTILGSTQAEAEARREELRDLIPVDYGHARLAGLLGLTPGELDLDAPLPDQIAPAANGGHTFARAVIARGRRGNLTLRQLIRELDGGMGHRTVVGTPEQVADDIEAWFRAGAADGFNLMPDVLPTGLETFVDEVVPLLQARGLFRRDYEGATLRDHLGLARPSCRRDAALAAE